MGNWGRIWFYNYTTQYQYRYQNTGVTHQIYRILWGQKTFRNNEISGKIDILCKHCVLARIVCKYQ